MHDTTKTQLRKYLQEGRDALLWKIQDLSEYDRRRPVTDTGTNLLGLVKHVAWTEAEYFTDVFDRPLDPPLPWTDDDERNIDMWATPEQTTESITGTYRRIWTHTDTVIDELNLDAPGHVPWWGNPDVTLGRILIHMIAETHRHAGHADILRETIDGTTGLAQGNTNMPTDDPRYWADYRERLEQAAAQFR